MASVPLSSRGRSPQGAWRSAKQEHEQRFDVIDLIDVNGVQQLLQVVAFRGEPGVRHGQILPHRCPIPHVAGMLNDSCGQAGGLVAPHDRGCAH